MPELAEHRDSCFVQQPAATAKAGTLAAPLVRAGSPEAALLATEKIVAAKDTAVLDPGLVRSQDFGHLED